MEQTKIILNKRADKLELLRIAEAVALEKSIDKELIISSMETGIAKLPNLNLVKKMRLKFLSIETVEILSSLEN